MRKVRINPFSTSARPEKQIEVPHDLAESLKALDVPFQSKFGREPGPEDPFFFDPDAVQPHPPTGVQQQEIIAAMHPSVIGLNPAIRDRVKSGHTERPKT